MAWLKIRNKAREGMTNQKIPIDNSDTFVRSLVSSYKKMKAMMEINGREAKMAPQRLDLLATSEMK